MSKDIQHIRDVAMTSKLLYGKDEVESAIDKMAFRIESALSGANPLCLTVLVGGLIATGALLRRLHFPLEIDYIHATRYRGEMEGKDLHFKALPSRDLKDRTILLIDDILDGGVTLAGIKKYCEDHGAARVYTAVLITKDKVRDKQAVQKADFCGMNIPDQFIYGYGMDYQEYLRNAPGIFAVPEDE